jgi:hypothetical protein
MQTTTDSFSNVDTATLEAALEAASSGVAIDPAPAAPQAEAEPQPASPEIETTATEAPEASEEVESAEEESSADSEDSETENPEDSYEESEEEVEEPQPYDPRADWQDYERLAAEIRERNPDILLDTALAMAKVRLGYEDPSASYQEPEAEMEEGDPEPTTAEKIAALEAALEEEGANEGLFTPKVAELTKEHARMLAQHAVEQAEQRIYQQRENDIAANQAANHREQLLTGMAESRARVLEICPDAGDATTPIGRAMTQVIENYQSRNHPDLSEPNAPEIIFARANMLLPPEARVPVTPFKESPKPQPKPAPKAKTHPVPMKSEAPPLPTAPPVPTMRVLPVAAGAGTAQPDMSNLNPAQMSQLVREASPEDLDAIEAALYGMSGRDVLLRI